MKKTNTASELLRRRFRDDPEYQAMLDEERLIAQASQAIYDARTAANLSQQQLAEKIGTSQPAIARLEDGDYDRHSVATLQRIADALELKLSIRFVSENAAAARAVLTEEAIRQVVREELRACIPALCQEINRASKDTVKEFVASRD